MDRVYGANTVATEPAFSADAPTGYPTDGSSTGGVSATVPKAAWYNAVTEEIRNAIKGGGVTPNRNDNTQLNQSIDARLDPIRALIEAAKAELNARIDALEATPPGLIGYFATTTPPSSYWLICDGRAVSRTVYANLFAKIGTTYGGGNGSTTFNLPDLRDRVAWGATSSVGATIAAGLPNITGTTDGIEAENYGQRQTGAFYLTGEKWLGTNDSDYDNMRVGFDASRCSSIYGRSSTVQPPAMKLLPCIHI
jgi:hypothetical protein